MAQAAFGSEANSEGRHQSGPQAVVFLILPKCAWKSSAQRGTRSQLLCAMEASMSGWTTADPVSALISAHTSSRIWHCMRGHVKQTF
eukprot:5778380-Amphidinium_carterae.1